MAAKGSVQSLSYNQNKNEMTVEILLRNYDQVEQIEADLAEQASKAKCKRGFCGRRNKRKTQGDLLA